MDGNDGSDGPLKSLVEHPARFILYTTVHLKVLAKPLNVHVASALVDVYKVGRSPSLANCLASGDKSVGDGHYHVALFDARRDEREAQGVCAAAHTDTKLGLAELRETSLEILNHGTSDKAGRIHRMLENCHQLGFEFPLGGHKVKKRNSD